MQKSPSHRSRVPWIGSSSYPYSVIAKQAVLLATVHRFASPSQNVHPNGIMEAKLTVTAAGPRRTRRMSNIRLHRSSLLSPGGHLLLQYKIVTYLPIRYIAYKNNIKTQFMQ